jgi:dipeptidyl aminopeptidase/acylaminoacyl peptidase
MSKQWGWALAALVAFAPVQAQPPAPAAPVDVDQYLREDPYLTIKISPDGKHYAATVHWDDRVGLVILRRADNKVVSSAAGEKGSEVQGFWWVSDEHVVMATAERLGSRDEPYLTGQLFSLGLDSERVKLLAGGTVDGLALEHSIARMWEMAELIDTLPGEARHVLVASWDAGVEPRTGVERIDVVSGSRRLVARAPVRRASFVTDAAGQVRFAAGLSRDNHSQLWYLENADAEWRLLNDQAQSGRIERPVGFAADGATAYLQVSQASGPDVIVAYDTASGERREVLRHATADPYVLIHDRDQRTLLGAQYMADGVSTRLLDEQAPTARLQRALERAFPGAAVNITSYTADGGEALVQVWSDRIAGDIYIFDTRKLTALPVMGRRMWLDPTRLAPTRAVQLPARDGLTLHGYLTLPRGAASAAQAAPAPMVVLPHGGPFGVFDGWGYSDETQLLAQAGYAVLRLNFRGSGNHGRAYQEAGARQWGASMQDDLTDATQWAIAQKIADPARICIYGASYGGYAALMGAAREPDLYRCAVGYVGVYDLVQMHRQDSRTSISMRHFANDWIGERDALAARSPVNLAHRIRASVLLAAGGLDRIAPISHSRQMERALVKAGVPVETLYYDTEGHGFYTLEHRREFYARLLDFLGRHLGGARAAPAPAGERQAAGR